jgi:hypothetical protein
MPVKWTLEWATCLHENDSVLLLLLGGGRIKPSQVQPGLPSCCCRRQFCCHKRYEYACCLPDLWGQELALQLYVFVCVFVCVRVCVCMSLHEQFLGELFE